MQDILFGQDLDMYIQRVKFLDGKAKEARGKWLDELPLRDMSAWTALRAAQAWIAKQEPPRCAWQGDRVRRAALEIGYRRPVMEGEHVGLMRTRMSFNQLSYDVAVFPDGILGRRIPQIAVTLLHEATHLVTRELFCERFDVTSDEAFVICDLNMREARRTCFLAEALAFWNEASWVLTKSPEDVGEGGSDELMIVATDFIRRPDDAVDDFAEGLAQYARRSLSDFTTGISLPVVYPNGSRAGLPINVSDLAPRILKPLLGVAKLE